MLALVAEPEVDLSPLTSRLWANKIAHRVIPQEGKQCLYLADSRDIEQVKNWLEEWQQGQLDDADLIVESQSGNWLLKISEAPLAFLFIPLFLAVFAWMHISTDWNAWVMLGQALWPEQRLSLEAYAEIGLWDLWRPTLLHFSFLHILMNMLWWWVLARRIEVVDGKAALLLVILLCGLIGNAAQWWYAGPGFGGASGVTLGMLAWVATRERRFRLGYQVPPVLLTVMVAWLLLTLLGDTVVPGLSGTAHGAHLGGLICGLLFAQLWPVRRFVHAPSTEQSDLTKTGNQPDSRDN